VRVVPTSATGAPASAVSRSRAASGSVPRGAVAGFSMTRSVGSALVDFASATTGTARVNRQQAGSIRAASTARHAW
jgi:hypothetical protein